MILEAEMESLVAETLRLGFGKCALQVQVPEAGPVRSVEALVGKRIVTSFEVLAGRFFKDIDERAGLVAPHRLGRIPISQKNSESISTVDLVGEWMKMKMLTFLLSPSFFI